MNADVLVLKSAEGATEVSLRRPDELNLEVEISTPGLQARTAVYEPEPFALVDLFERMARDWRGWEGIREWQSLEGDLRLSCTSDHLGHISIRLETYSDCSKRGWMIGADLVLEAGQLDQLARDSTRLISGRRGRT